MLLSTRVEGATPSLIGAASSTRVEGDRSGGEIDLIEKMGRKNTKMACSAGTEMRFLSTKTSWPIVMSIGIKYLDLRR